MRGAGRAQQPLGSGRVGVWEQGDSLKRQALGFAVLILVAACGDGAAGPDTSAAPSTTEVPSTTTSEAATTTTAPTTTIPACPSIDATLPDEPGLPAGVDATRRAVFDTAHACDAAGLADLARGDGFEWLGTEDEVSEYFEKLGDIAFSAIGDLLRAPYGTSTADGVTVYVWPSAAAFEDWASVPEPDRASLVAHYGEGLLDEVEYLWDGGYWQGPELAIDETGAWVWFLICKGGC